MPVDNDIPMICGKHRTQCLPRHTPYAPLTYPIYMSMPELCRGDIPTDASAVCLSGIFPAYMPKLCRRDILQRHISMSPRHSLGRCMPERHTAKVVSVCLCDMPGHVYAGETYCRSISVCLPGIARAYSYISGMSAEHTGYAGVSTEYDAYHRS